MNRLCYAIGGLIVGAAILGGVSSRPSSAVAQDKAPAAVPAWEYHIYSGSPQPSEFDKLGSQGWELSLMVPGENLHRHSYIFKRPKP